MVAWTKHLADASRAYIRQHKIIMYIGFTLFLVGAVKREHDDDLSYLCICRLRVDCLFDVFKTVISYEFN